MSRQTTEEIKTVNRSSAPADAKPDHEKIKTLAYKLWVERGAPIGSPEEDWYRAEAQLKEPRTVQQAA